MAKLETLTEGVSAREAGRLLGYHEAYVRRLVREQKRRADRFGGSLVVPRSEIDRIYGRRYERQ